MPKKKNKNKNLLESLAKAILANSQKAFYLGANNKGSTPVSSQQAVFIQQKIKYLIENDTFFEKKLKKLTKLKKISLKNSEKIKAIRVNYKKENIESRLWFLSFFYDASSLKKEFETENKKNIKWNDGWLDDLNLILAASYSAQYRKDNYKFLSEDSETYDKLRIEGVPDQGKEREIYFLRSIFDINVATLHGTGACELMAEFALFEAIRMSKVPAAYSIYYIRFLSEKYEEINAIALGDWPNEDSLVVCPWLEKGENLIWKRDLLTTRFANYPEANIKVIFKIVPGDEMNTWRKALATVDFLADTQEKQTIRNNIEKLSENYKNAFAKFFPNKNADENQSVLIRRLGR